MGLLIVGLMLALPAWLACGYVAAAMSFAYFQRNWPSLATQDLDRDRGAARLVFLSGLIALAVHCCFRDYRHGFIWTWPWYSDTSSGKPR